MEVKAFNKPKTLNKMSIEVEGVLLSRDRMAHNMQFQETAELDLDLGAMGIRTHLPLLDRLSPLSYCIALYVHWSLASHRGAESCARISLETVHIMQGAGLCQELGEDFTPCKIKRSSLRRPLGHSS